MKIALPLLISFALMRRNRCHPSHAKAATASHSSREPPGNVFNESLYDTELKAKQSTPSCVLPYYILTLYQWPDMCVPKIDIYLITRIEQYGIISLEVSSAMIASDEIGMEWTVATRWHGIFIMLSTKWPVLIQ